MSFRTRLVLTFTLITTGILISMCLVIYFFAEYYTRLEFYARLSERSNITAQMYLEQDELSPRAFLKISTKYLQTLPQEVLDIFDRNRKPRFILDSTILVAPPNIFEQLNSKNKVEFRQGKKQGVGLYYKDNQGDFYIIVSAYDQYGNSKLRNLREVLMLTILCGALISFGFGYYFSRRVLGPFGELVRQVNKIRASNLHLRVPERSSRDEIGQLTQTFN